MELIIKSEDRIFGNHCKSTVSVTNKVTGEIMEQSFDDLDEREVLKKAYHMCKRILEAK